MEIVGVLRPSGCCLFTFRQRDTGPRIVEVRDGHCQNCVDAMRTAHPDLRILDRRAQPPSATTSATR